MFHFFVFGVIGLVIFLAMIALLRERALLARHDMSGNRARAIPLAVSPKAEKPVRLDNFDPGREALLVQIPEVVARNLDPADFVTRPNAAGEGQELLFRNRVLVDLPKIGSQRRIDLYVEPLPG